MKLPYFVAYELDLRNLNTCICKYNCAKELEVGAVLCIVLVRSGDNK